MDFSRSIKNGWQVDIDRERNDCSRVTDLVQVTLPRCTACIFCDVGLCNTINNAHFTYIRVILACSPLGTIVYADVDGEWWQSIFISYVTNGP